MLKIRTGYSFRQATGKLELVMARLKEIGAEYAPITDRASTFGFYRWSRLAAKAGLEPVFGVEIAVVDRLGEKRPNSDYWTFIARDALGPINRLVELATNQFYYQPMITVDQALAFEDVEIVTGYRPMIDFEDTETVEKWAARGVKFALGPSAIPGVIRGALAHGFDLSATSDNRYTTEADRNFYETLVGRNSDLQEFPQHILSEEEWRASVADLELAPEALDAALAVSAAIAARSTARPGKAKLPTPPRPDTLEAMCRKEAPALGIDLTDPVYEARLRKEIDLIEAKQFEDYFYIVADIVQWARKKMIVGPARGSSCGSLVCYLLRITTVDPIPHGLIFERFIDLNRNDLPDIDIDFSDQQRPLVFDYITEKYGREYTARLGTVANFHPRSAMQESGMAMGVPKWKTDAVADVLIERYSAYSRALDTLLDTIKSTDAGKKLMAEHPEMEIATQFEGHPRHYSQHAAGVVVASQPITDFVAVDRRTGATMCDKKDAEDGYGLLKIDALGLTQLSIFEDALELAHLPRDFLEGLPLDDQAAFDVLNKQQWAGIFQFNGQALQSLAKQVHIWKFEDIVNITALARPGALASGGAASWVNRKNTAEGRGRVVEPVSYVHELFRPHLEDTLGVVAYQEQVMNIGREIGDLSWEDVTALRKAMSKSLGKEFFDQFGDRWKAGAIAKGIPASVLDKVWDDLCAYGSWSFNKSHSVAYGLISYWCCWMKAHFPFEFAAATLNHVDDTGKMIQVLREMAKEGFDYQSVDPQLSGKKWGTILGPNGERKLLGPLSIVRGLGPKTVATILGARARGERMPQRCEKLLKDPQTDIDSLWPIRDRIRTLMPDPLERNIITAPTAVEDITEDHNEDKTFLVFVVAKAIRPRDDNDAQKVASRGYAIKSGPTMTLNLQLEDDTGVLFAKIGRFNYEKLAKPVLARGRAGKAIYAVKGTAMAGRRFLMVDSIRYIGDMEESK